MLNGYMPKFKRQHYPGTELNFRSGSRNNKITRKTSQSELNQLYEEDIQHYEETLEMSEDNPNFVQKNIEQIKRNSQKTKFNIRPIKQPQKFNKNQTFSQTVSSKVSKAPLNLVTSSHVPYNQESSPKSSKASLIKNQILYENRLVSSKHILVKTFNRYLSNPKTFLAQQGGFQDLIDLNKGFDDVSLAVRLFRSGKDTFRRSME